MTVDPLALELLASLPVLHALGPDEARLADARRVAAWTAGGEFPAVSSIEAVIGGVPVRVVTPPGPGPFPTVVHCHGGGWVVGSPSTYALPVARLAAACSAVVVDVDYRLAPEHPFPAALDDCWAVVTALPGPVGVAGDSGGGALAAALTLRARSEEIPLLAQLLVYPSVSLVRGWPSWKQFARGGGLDPEESAWFADCYAPAGVDRRSPLVSPYEAAALAGLPPAVVAVAEIDPLRDGGLAYAQRLADEGVPVVSLVARGQVHGYLHMPTVPRAAAAEASAHKAFRELLHRPQDGRDT
ncbi:MAG: Esterase/lipase/thioesterase, partial [Frankiales bacterium]|nr:Esterase/lipase/thioesterase [Frankiales bacterium]